MAIKCGKCRCYHETVADVRTCHEGGRAAVVDNGEFTPVPNKPTGPTIKQRELIQSLHRQLDMPEYPDIELDSLDYAATRNTIDGLMAQVAQAKAEGTAFVDKSRHFQAADWPHVPDGYYALPCETGSNDLDFLMVDVPTSGRWEGYLFVKRVLGGHDPERVSRSVGAKWLERLSEPGAARAASEAFGREMGRCGRCGRTLTDETSRALGIGPDCAAKGF